MPLRAELAQVIIEPAGQDERWTFTHVDGIDVSGWAFKFRAVPVDGGTAIEITDQFDLTNAATGVVVMTLAKATTQGLEGLTYAWQLNRTNSGNAWKLAGGTRQFTEDV